MWKYIDQLGEDEKKELIDRLTGSAKEMAGNIKGLSFAELQVNVNKDEPHDLALYCEFESFDDVISYQTDPVHLAFKSILKGKVFDRVCIDCEKA